MPGDVLIIEADDEVAQQIAHAVEERGLAPRITGDGKDGYDQALHERPSAIVLCAELPRVSGYSICAKLKKDPALKDVPLVFTSAEASASTFEHHKKLKVRADEYLSKPFSMDQLLDLLGRHVPLEAAVEDEIPISEDFGIESMPIEAPAVGDADDPFGDNGAFSSTDMAFEAALDAISEQPAAFAPEPSLAPAPGPDAARTEPPRREPPRAEAPSASSRSYEPSTPPSSAPAPAPAARPAEGAVGEARAYGTGDLERLGGGASSQRALLALKKDLNQKDRELFELRDQLHAKDRDILGLRDRETELEGRVVQAEDDNEALRARVYELEQAVASLQDGKASAERARSDAERGRADAEQRVQAAQAELSRVKRELDETAEARSEAEAEVERLRSEGDGFRRERDQLRRAHESLEAEREERERRLHEAEEAASRARSALESGLEILRTIS